MLLSVIFKISIVMKQVRELGIFSGFFQLSSRLQQKWFVSHSNTNHFVQNILKNQYFFSEFITLWFFVLHIYSFCTFNLITTEIIIIIIITYWKQV